MFATIMLAVLDASSSKLHYINGGHEASIIINSDGIIKLELEPTGPAFGFSADIPFEVGKIDFDEGDLLIAFTDGLTEAKNLSGDFYSDERLIKKIQKKWDSAYSIIKAVEYDVSLHIGDHKQFDDITLVALRRENNSFIKHHTIRELAEIEKLPLFKKFMVDTCKKMKVDQEIIERLKLAVDEICTNIITYGYENLVLGEIIMSIKIQDEEIEVVIKDTGNPFDSSDIETPDLSEELFERDIGGLGLFFVKETIDDVKYKRENGCNILTLKIKK